jgi:hypothetical protein
VASLLETFGILFESDAEDVKKGAEEAGKATDDLEDKISATDVTAEKLGKSFLGLTSSAKSALASVVGFAAISAGIVNAAQQADQVGKFSEVLGLSVQEVGAWSEAVIRAGGSAQGFQSSIMSLTSQLTDFVITGGGPAMEVLARLGVSAFDAQGKVKTAFDLLPDLADAFERLSAAEAFAFGQKLGLDQSTILLLQQGRREVEELVRRQKALGVTTKEDAKLAAEFNDAWADFTQQSNDVFRALGTTVLPILTKVFSLVDDFTDLLVENKDLVIGFFIGIAGAITAYYLPVMIAAAGAAIAAMAPFLLLAAIVTAIGVAFALVYEDVVAFMNGQDSLIGKMLEKWPVLGEIIDTLKESFKSFAEFVGKAFDFLLTLPDKIVEGFKKVKDSIPEIPSFSDIKEGALGLIGLGDGETDEALEMGKSQIINADNNPLNGQTAGSIGAASTTANTSTSVSVGSVNVDARGGDSNEIASGVSSALSEQMKQAVNNFDDGVLA